MLGGRKWVVDPPKEGGTEGRFPNRPTGHWEEQPGMITGLLESTKGGTVRSSLDEANYQAALSQLNKGYGQAAFGNKEAINYGALRSGEGRLSGAVPQSAIASSATALERDRQTAINNLNFQSASASMSDYNQLLSLMGQGVNASLGLAQGFSGASGAAIGGLSNTSQFGSTLGGATSGAALGSQVNVPWGTIVGGVVGGAAGYLGSG